MSANDIVDKTRIGGEYLIRQYLSPREAEMFARAEDRKGTESMNDIVIAGLRGLPRVLEIDNGIMRAVKNHYYELTGSEVAVHVITVQHSQANSSYFDTHADEPVLVVTFLKLKTGGSLFRRTWRENNGGGEIRIGSVSLQVFTELSDIHQTTPTTSGRIWDIDARRIKGSSVIPDDMGRIYQEIGYTQKLYFLVKARGEQGADDGMGI